MFFFQILCSRRHLPFNSTKRRTPLTFNPMKKIKVSTDKEKKSRGRKRKLPEANLTTNNEPAEKKSRERKRKLPKANSTTKNEPAKKKKKSSSEKDDANLTSTVDSECIKPTENLFKTLKLKWPKVSNLDQEKNKIGMINTHFSKLSFDQKNKTKQVKKKKPLIEEWKCKRIDEYLTKCDKIIPPALEKSQECLSSDLWGSNTLVVVQKLPDEIIPSALEKSQECLSSDVCESKAVMVVQTLLDEIMDSIYTQTYNGNTDHAGDKNAFNLELRSKSGLLDHTDDQFQNCETVADFFESEISPTPKEPFLSLLESPQDISLMTNTPESRDNSIFFVKNTSNKINKQNNETESSSSSLKTECVSASPQKSTFVSKELVLQSSMSLMECRNVSPKVLNSNMLKKSNSKHSCKGFFPRIKFSGHTLSQRNDFSNSKNLKKSKKAVNDVQERESFNKQENKPKKTHSYIKYNSSNYLKTKSVGGENKVSIIDHYFSHLKKDAPDFKSSLDIQKIDVGSSLNSSGEENKNDSNSYSPSSPEKKPLVELQFSMLPFCGF